VKGGKTIEEHHDQHEQDDDADDDRGGARPFRLIVNNRHGRIVAWVGDRNNVP
jgi:hypothetical protein